MKKIFPCALALAILLLGGCSGEGGQGNAALVFPEKIETAEVTYSVYSSQITRPLGQEEAAAVQAWAAALVWEEAPLDETEAPNHYAGGVQWDFRYNGGDLEFSYVNYGSAAILLGDHWYAVENPSDPPVKAD